MTLGPFLLCDTSHFFCRARFFSRVCSHSVPFRRLCWDACMLLYLISSHQFILPLCDTLFSFALPCDVAPCGKDRQRNDKNMPLKWDKTKTRTQTHSHCINITAVARIFMMLARAILSKEKCKHGDNGNRLYVQTYSLSPRYGFCIILCVSDMLAGCSYHCIIKHI